MSPTLLPAAALPSQVALHNDGTDQSLPPSLPFLHLWTGPDGLSRLNTSQLAGFQSKSVGGGAAPQWLRPFPGEVVGVQFAVLPVGWVGDWHESPHPQWVIRCAGAGLSKPATARAWKWALAISISARTRAPPTHAATAPANWATRTACR